MELKILPIPTIIAAISILLITGCGGSVRQSQYAVQGARIYKERCSNCHQQDGKGLARLYPPLLGSEWISKKPEQVICLIRNGISGPIEVAGQTYDNQMAGQPDLTELEIAELMTWMRGEWAADTALVTVGQVKQALEKCRQAD